MKTLITPAQAVALAFTNGEYLPPESIAESDIAAAEQRYIVPVIGRKLYERLLDGAYSDFAVEYIAAPIAIFTRAGIQTRLDVRTGACGTIAPKSAAYQPATTQALLDLRRNLKRQVQVLLRRASEHLEAHADDFAEYNPEANILKRCSTEGGFVGLY